MAAERPARVCVVDDDDAVRDSLAWLLRTSGYAVSAYPTAEALLAAEAPDAADCLVLDIRMPGLSGLELQEELERRGYAAPIVFVTGHGDVPLAVTAMQHGAFHFIEKPFNDRVLLDVVVQAVAAGVKAREARGRRATLLGRLERLTPRERDVLQRVFAGKLNKVTADELGVTIKTIEAHRAQIMKKLQVDSTAELVRLLAEVWDNPKT